MLEEFESYFDLVDVKELRAFIKEAKNESEELKKESNEDPEVAHVANFMTLLLNSIEEEIEGVKELSTLDIKKKIRLYALVHLFHDLCNAMGDDEEWEDDDDEDEDDYEEDDELEDDDEEVEEEDTRKDGEGRIIKF